MRTLIVLASMALAGCAAPAAVQVASFAVDGAAYAITGKGTTDHALSLFTGADCRLSNAVRDKAVCPPEFERQLASLDEDAAGDEAALARAAARLAARTAPAAGPGTAAPPRGRVRLVRSPGMNLVELSGFPAATRLSGAVGGDGTLTVYAAVPGADRRPVFTVAGYARRPGVFTGVLLGTEFVPPGRIPGLSR